MQIQPLAFPSNPKIGQRHTESYSINFDTIARSLGWTGAGLGINYILANSSKTELAKAIVSSTGLGVFGAALSIAGLIFGEASRVHTGMTVSIEYVYTYNNDGYLTWVMGPMSHRFW